MTLTMIAQTLAAAYLLLVGAALFVSFGWGLAHHKLHRERRAVAEGRTALDAEWRALDNVRQVRAIFLGARRAMQDEAQRHYRRDLDAEAS